jgi:hypothetical protein
MKFLFLFMANFCKNCAFFEYSPYDSRMHRSVCLKFDGKMTDICRQDQTKCGIEGKFYVDKEKQPTHEPNFSCRGCKFYEPSLQRCKMFKKINQVTGLSNLEYTELCRRDENKCGKYGKFYTPYSIHL